MQNSVCVTPGSRAGRVLLAMLISRCQEFDLALVPPQLLTPGALSRELLVIDRAIAEDNERLPAWIEALRSCGANALAPLLPELPDDDDLLAWHDLARTIDGLHVELAAENLSFARVPIKAECLEMFAEGDRWRALEEVARRYRGVLGDCGLADSYEAAKSAIENGRVRRRIEILLIGVTELNAQQRAIIEAATDEAISLIHAPPELADSFDECGCVLAEAWRDVRLDIADERIIIAGGPEDQAQAAIRAIAGFEGKFAADQITIGMGDSALVEPMERAAGWAKLQVHSATGTPLAHTGPYRLLQAVSTWLGDQRFVNFASLLRHPDVDSWLSTRLADSSEGDAAGVGDWLILLDRYFADHLHERLSGRWLGDPDRRRRLKAVWDAVHELLEPVAGGARSLGEWCRPVLDLLSNVYGDISAKPGAPDRQLTIAACLKLRDALGQLANVPPRLRISADASTMIALLLADTAGEAIASDIRGREIDMLGWLELPLDPAPALVLLGCNDGKIPEAVSADMFLPDTLRRALGLMHNNRRYARDAYRLQSLVASRERTVIITGRTSASGEPLQPSRLLLACDDDALLRRVRLICEDLDEPTWAPPIGAPTSGQDSGFVIPSLPPNIAPPESMSVTEFRNYLACPFRYALGRLLRLRSMDDGATELDAAKFGTLAHDVLEVFGRDPAIKDSVNAEQIEDHLLNVLDDTAADAFGHRPPPAVQLQIARLRQRLAAFSTLQAKLRAEGWIIKHTELAFKEDAELDIPGEAPMPIRGKIDRIDYNERTGEYRIIDYKTSEGGSSPHDTHHGRKTLPKEGELEWQDLQLPLYRHLAKQRGISANFQLAYIVLPKKADSVEIKLAEWTDAHIESALELAREIVRNIRAGRFDINEEYQTTWDEFDRICQTYAYGDENRDAAAPHYSGGRK